MHSSSFLRLPLDMWIVVQHWLSQCPWMQKQILQCNIHFSALQHPAFKVRIWQCIAYYVLLLVLPEQMAQHCWPTTILHFTLIYQHNLFSLVISGFGFDCIMHDDWRSVYNSFVFSLLHRKNILKAATQGFLLKWLKTIRPFRIDFLKILWITRDLILFSSMLCVVLNPSVKLKYPLPLSCLLYFLVALKRIPMIKDTRTRALEET